MCPLLLARAMVQPRSLRRLGEQPPSARGRVLPLLRRRVKALQPPRRGGPETRSPRAGLEVCGPRAGHVGPPGEESPGALQDVSSRLQVFFVVFLSTCFPTSTSVLLADTPTPAFLDWCL
jgi:hypothetical protein